MVLAFATADPLVDFLDGDESYKDVTEVVDAADRAGLARKIARVEPVVCVKG